MRVVSLSPYITSLITGFGLGDVLVAGTSACRLPSPTASPLPIVLNFDAIKSGQKFVLGKQEDWRTAFAGVLNLDLLREQNPDLVLGLVNLALDEVDALSSVADELKRQVGETTKVALYLSSTLEQVYELHESVGKILGVPAKGADLSRKFKAQLMDWCDNFYERMKNKRAVIISGLNPLTLAGQWLPDLVKLCSATPYNSSGKFDALVAWGDLKSFNPDVIFIAVRGVDLDGNLRTLQALEQVPEWMQLSAVKRGDVLFCDGQFGIYSPGMELFDGLSVLVSGIAGMDSGYISGRDSFRRLRWLELQRHKYR